MELNPNVEFYSITAQNGILHVEVKKRIYLGELTALMAEMKKKGVEMGIYKLLLDVSKIDFRDLTIAERHDLGIAGAQLFAGGFRVALVVQKQFINKHGENVASNRGADVLVCDSFEEAYIWLGK